MEALLALTGVWSVLALAPGLAAWVPPDVALVGSHAVASLVLVATRTPGAVEARASPVVLAFAWTAGHASYPVWILLTFAVGSALALEPLRDASGVAPPALWISAGLLAPLFEELLYRERIFDALCPRIGAAAAVVLASALFALPHTGPWQQTGTFLVGLGLGALRAAGAPIGACVAAHAGLNAAGLLWGRAVSS